jgi:hypothetical protein
MCSFGATVFCVHSMGMAVLGEGCSFPVNVGQGVASAAPTSSGRSPLSRLPLRSVRSRPLVRAGVGAKEGVLRRSDWDRDRAFDLLTAWVRLWPGSSVWEVPCGFLLSAVGETLCGSWSVAGFRHNMYEQVVLRIVFPGRG